VGVLGEGYWAERFKKMTKKQAPMDLFEERMCKIIRDDCYQCPFCFIAVGPPLFFRHFSAHLRERDSRSKPYYCLPSVKSFPRQGSSQVECFVKSCKEVLCFDSKSMQGWQQDRIWRAHLLQHEDC